MGPKDNYAILPDQTGVSMFQDANGDDSDDAGALDQHSMCHADRAYQLRCRAALESFERIPPGNAGDCHGPLQTRNDDEDGTPGALETNAEGNTVHTGVWCYSKGLRRRPGSPRNALGEPDPEAYESLLKAIETTKPTDFEQVKITAVEKGLTYRKLTNPQAGIDYDLEGLDSHAFVPPPPPSVTDALTSAEIGEDYWMAVLRDVHFKFYRSDFPPPPPPPGSEDAQARELVTEAAHYLSSKDQGGDFSEINWPPVKAVVAGQDCLPPGSGHRLGIEQMRLPALHSGHGKVTEDLLFRGFDEGSQKGPFISQFLLRGNSDNYISVDSSTGKLTLSPLQVPQDGFFTDGTNPDNQRQKTVKGRQDDSRPDFMTSEDEWRQVQEGYDTTGRDKIDVDPSGKATVRFLRNLRDLATYVHLCDVTSPYVNAAFIMYGENAAAMNCQRVSLAANPPVPLPPLPFPMNPGNPYTNASNTGVSKTQVGFATFDISHYISLVNEVAWKVHKVQWFQKWFVHRRMRPEEFGGRIHFQIVGSPVTNPYPAIQGSEIITALTNPLVGLGKYFSNGDSSKWFQTYLLPQVFPEGSPTHPAYGQGHGCLGGAAVTILKAFFDDRAMMTDPGNTSLDPDTLPPAFISSDDGLSLKLAEGSQQVQLTVGGELDKLAANISLGRDAAGVHWRTDYMESVLLGEAFAISVLLEQSVCYRLKSTNHQICSFNERRGADFHKAPYFEFTKFDGVRIRIANGRVRVVSCP